jgi:hypothetical protein
MNRHRLSVGSVSWLVLVVFATLLLSDSASGQVKRIWAPDPLSPPCKPLDVEADTQEMLNAAGVPRSFLSSGGNWTVLWNEYNATPNTIIGEGTLLAPGPFTRDQVLELSLQFVEDNYNLFRVHRDQLQLERLDRTDPLTGDAIWYVTFNQVHQGLPISQSRLDLTIVDDGTLRLVGSQWLFPEIDIDTQPVLSDQDAFGLVLNQISFNPATDQLSGELDVYPCSPSGIEPRLAWKVLATTVDPPKNWAFHIDANTGDILHSWDGVVYGDVFGNVSGRGISFDPLSGLSQLPMGNIGVFGSAGAFGWTAANGFYDIFVGPDPATTLTDLGSGGLYSRIINQGGGGQLFAVGTAPQPGPINLVLNPSGSAEFDVAQVNGYYHANGVHEFWQNVMIPRIPGIDIAVPTNVNLNQTCNAFYTGNTINFFRAGNGCVNTAYDTVIYHEYGHFVHDNLGGINDGALSEGIGDTSALTGVSRLLGFDQNLIGENFFGAGTTIRDGENNRQWPAAECGGEVHCVGEVYMGFNWHARRNMLNRGADVRVADDLILNSIRAHSPNIPAQVSQTFVTDIARYGSSPSDFSPDYYALCEAAVDKGFNSSAPPVIPLWADFGNAPAPYPSSLAANGARHRLMCAEWLGATNEPLPSVNGENDTRGPGETLNDGWTNYTGILQKGVPNTINLLVNTSGRRTRRYDPANPTKRLYLRAWVDWDGNGAWDDPSERVIDAIIDPTTFPVGQKMQTFSFNVTPPATGVANTWIRIRLSYGETTTPLGSTEFGEVEDYRVQVVP